MADREDPFPPMYVDVHGLAWYRVGAPGAPGPGDLIVARDGTLQPVHVSEGLWVVGRSLCTYMYWTRPTEAQLAAHYLSQPDTLGT